MVRHALLALLACCACAEDSRGLKPLAVTAPDGTEVTRFTSHHALIIGNSRYTAGWQPLPGVVEDIAAVQGALERQGFAVQVARDLTRAQMDETITAFVAERGQDPSGRVVLYYAGHGQTLKNPQGGQETGYLVPVDAPVPAEGNRPAFIARAFPIQRIKIAAQEIGSRHALFVFDACFSGSLFAPLRGGGAAVLRQAAEPVRMFITSGSSDEQVPDHSVFREEFVAALDEGAADLNRDGWTTGSELSLHLRQQVASRRAAAGGTQTPQAGISEQSGMNKGDVVFNARPAAGPSLYEQLTLKPPVPAPAEPAPQPAGAAPAWAAATGSDEVGPWAELAVGTATQRLRLVRGGGGVGDLWVLEAECSQRLWFAVMGANPSGWTGQTRLKELMIGSGTPEPSGLLPVETVSWDDTQAFLAKLNATLPGLLARLPTEAEWTWAATLGAQVPPAVVDGARVRSTARNPQPASTAVPNPAGLRDMLGNVWEWCADPWNQAPRQDPALERALRLGRNRDDLGAADRRVLRGGGFLDKAATAESRLGEAAAYRSRDIGFRFVVTP